MDAGEQRSIGALDPCGGVVWAGVGCLGAVVGNEPLPNRLPVMGGFRPGYSARWLRRLTFRAGPGLVGWGSVGADESESGSG